MESGSCISTATFIQIITKSPSPQFAGWGMIFMLPSQRDIVLFLRLSSTLLIGALSLLAKNYFIVKKKAPLFNKETSKF